MKKPIEHSKGTMTCKIRQDLVEQVLCPNIGKDEENRFIVLSAGQPNSFLYRWLHEGTDKEQFQIYYQGEWCDAQSIDFEFPDNSEEEKQQQTMFDAIHNLAYKNIVQLYYIMYGKSEEEWMGEHFIDITSKMAMDLKNNKRKWLDNVVIHNAFPIIETALKTLP